MIYSLLNKIKQMNNYTPNKIILLFILLSFFFMKIKLKSLAYLIGKVPSNYIKNYMRKNFKSIILSDYTKLPTKDGSQIIWTLWLQGVEKAPKVVLNCFQSQKKMAKNIGFKHVILSEKTLEQYLSIPIYIIEKYQNGTINAAHYADYIRSKLLYNYGGVWLDATCFAYRDLDPEIVINYDFWNAKGIDNNYFDRDITRNYQNNVIAARSGSHLYLAMTKMFELYFARKNYHAITYLYTFYFYHLLITENSEFRKLFAKIPENNQYLFESYKAKKNDEINQILASDTSIYKLTYKVNNQSFNEKGELTFYGSLLMSLVDKNN